MARYTELSPTGSETSGTDRQSEIVAATSGPITICCCSKAKKVKHGALHRTLTDRFRNFWH